MVSNLLKEYTEKSIAVFGLARSGLSVVKALRRDGVSVIAWDDNEKGRNDAAALGAQTTPLTIENLKSCSMLLLAPGVPLHYPAPHPAVTSARAAGIETICDVELFHRLNHGRKTIGITGTNGKSTTTALIHHILKEAGRDSVMGGNIGVPVFDLPMPGKDGIFVFELSSYQLDLCPTFRPDIAVLLNITPDHLDRHGTLQNYAAAKENIFEGPGTAIIGTDDEFSKAIYERVKAKGQRKTIPISAQDKNFSFLKVSMILKGDHNLQNAIAAYKACEAAGLSKDEILSSLRTFPGLPHRQFPVATINNVTYINDSKATNAEAASKALQSYDNIYWIAGGRPKEGGLNGLEQFAPRIRHSFLIGEAIDEFAVWMKKNNIPFHLSKTLDIAVREAAKAAGKSTSSTVLLAPACASWDQFSSYEERGDTFTRLVNELKESAAA